MRQKVNAAATPGVITDDPEGWGTWDPYGRPGQVRRSTHPPAFPPSPERVVRCCARCPTLMRSTGAARVDRSPRCTHPLVRPSHSFLPTLPTLLPQVDISLTPNRLLRTTLLSQASLQPGVLTVDPAAPGPMPVSLALNAAPTADVTIRCVQGEQAEQAQLWMHARLWMAGPPSLSAGLNNLFTMPPARSSLQRLSTHRQLGQRQPCHAVAAIAVLHRHVLEHATGACACVKGGSSGPAGTSEWPGFIRRLQA